MNGLPGAAGAPADLASVYLKPGEMTVREVPTRVTTVLGSCVAVTMYVSRLRVGALCHALLPRCRERAECQTGCAEPFKYVNCVVPEMIEAIKRRGVRLREIELKLFGGADMFAPRPGTRRCVSVGGENVKEAIRAVEAFGLRFKVSDVGGTRGRKIFFFTHTGEVWLKRLR